MNDIQTIAKDAADYPSLLAEIHDPPEQLYVRGKFPDGVYFAVVGTRLPSAYGKQVTSKIVEPLAQAGLVIVSGLAYGIDALAHEAALEAGGATVAVLGTGVDEESLYPRSHKKLARRIVEQGGAVISEYPPGTAGQPYHFPARNRIIAGLSRGVLVVEARKKSGALITSDLSTRENRDVFAVPGPIINPASFGPNQLIQQGANPVMSAEDILEEYDITQPTTDDKRHSTLNEEERRVLDALTEGALHVDAIGRALESPSAQLASLLTGLELKGLIKSLGGGTYGKA